MMDDKRENDLHASGGFAPPPWPTTYSYVQVPRRERKIRQLPLPAGWAWCVATGPPTDWIPRLRRHESVRNPRGVTGWSISWFRRGIVVGHRKVPIQDLLPTLGAPRGPVEYPRHETFS